MFLEVRILKQKKKVVMCALPRVYAPAKNRARTIKRARECKCSMSTQARKYTTPLYLFFQVHDDDETQKIFFS